MKTRLLALLSLCLLPLAGCNDTSSAPPGNGGGGGDGGGNGSGGDGGGPGGDGSAPPADLLMTLPLCYMAPADLATSKMQAKNCGVGQNASFFIRPNPYQKIVIEVNATAGASPRTAAIDHLKQVITDNLGKPGGVTVKMGDMNIAAPGHPLTIDEIRAIEDAHRQNYAGGDTVVFYYLIVSDPSKDDTNQFQVLGYAHRASSMVIFQNTINKISGGIGKPSADTVESTVVAHEFGHILGLVNIGTPMVTPHEDPQHNGHDVNTKCLMYYANNSSDLVLNVLQGGLIADFDAQCKADLAAVKNRM